MYELAELLQGEAGVCPISALVAIAWMVHRGAGPWYGKSAPDLNALLVARWYWYMEDPTPTARFCFSLQDLEDQRVAAIVSNRREVLRVSCGRLGLSFYE